MKEEIVAAIQAQMPDARVDAQIDGNRALITVVSAAFAGKSRVQQQQAVYRCIDTFIKDGTLHAVTIRAQTPVE
jgi:acid stress-induced BolA-like protein IbaG/YrbA